MKPTSFIAVDFETMTAEPTSVCAAGIVKVVEGYVYCRYYTLIKPVPDSRNKTNTWLHGIHREMCEDVPDFRHVYELLRAFTADGSPIVCHNRQADIRFIQACAEHYKLHGLDLSTNECTYCDTGLSLDEACAKYNIPLVNHHDALADAEACAQVYMRHNGIKKREYQEARPTYLNDTTKKIKRETLSVPTEEEIKNKSTVFYRSNCVITGTFERYPMREELAKLLRDYGADINTGISGKTTLVVVGSGAGPKKLASIEERRANGQSIAIVTESELYSILG